MAVRKEINIPFDISLLIVLGDSFSVFKHSSLSRGYHVYKDRWQPTVGDDFFCIMKKKKATSTTSIQLQ